MNKLSLVLLGLTSALTLTACGGGIEIEGVYNSNFGETVTITSDTVTSVSSFGTSTSTIIEFDNGANTVIAQSSFDNLFTISEWTEPDDAGAFAFCTRDFGLASVEAAQNSTKTVDASDLDGAGCGGFSWTRYTPTAAE